MPVDGSDKVKEDCRLDGGTNSGGNVGGGAFSPFKDW